MSCWEGLEEDKEEEKEVAKWKQRKWSGEASTRVKQMDVQRDFSQRRRNTEV